MNETPSGPPNIVYFLVAVAAKAHPITEIIGVSR